MKSRTAREVKYESVIVSIAADYLQPVGPHGAG